MPFFVAVHHDVYPERRELRLELIRGDFAASPIAHPGRRFARLFEHLHDPTRLMAFEEWREQADFERHEQQPAYVEALAASGPPPRPEVMERVQHFRHLPRRPAALAFTAISTPLDRAAEVERYICDEERRDALVASGLVLRAVYRVVGSPGRLFVLHGWQSLADLTAYQAAGAPALVNAVAAHGAVVDQFTGQVAAEFSWLEA